MKLRTVYTGDWVVNAIYFKKEIYSLSGQKFPKSQLSTEGWNYPFTVEFGFKYRKWLSRIIGWDKAYGYSQTYGKRAEREHSYSWENNK